MKQCGSVYTCEVVTIYGKRTPLMNIITDLTRFISLPIQVHSELHVTCFFFMQIYFANFAFYGNGSKKNYTHLRARSLINF